MGSRGQLKYTDWNETKYFPEGEQPEGWIATITIPRKERSKIPPLTSIRGIKKTQSIRGIKKSTLPKPEPEVKIKTTSWFNNHDKVRLEIFDWMRKCWDLSGIDLVVFSLIYNELEISTRELNDILGIDTAKSIANLKEATLIERVSGKELNTVWSITEIAEV